MVTLDAARQLTIDPAETGLTVGRAVRRRRAARRLQPRRPGAARSPGVAPTSRSTSTSRTAAGWAAVRRDAAAVLRWAGVDRSRGRGRRSAPTSRSASSAAAPASRGIGEIVEPLPYLERTVTLVDPAADGQHAGGLPRVGRPRWADRADGPNDLEAAAIAVEPELARWRDRIGERQRAAPDAGRQRRHVVRARANTATPSPRLSDEGAEVVAARTVPARCGAVRRQPGSRTLTTCDAGDACGAASSCASSCACACGAS